MIKIFQDNRTQDSIYTILQWKSHLPLGLVNSLCYFSNVLCYRNLSLLEGRYPTYTAAYESKGLKKWVWQSMAYAFCWESVLDIPVYRNKQQEKWRSPGRKRGRNNQKTGKKEKRQVCLKKEGIFNCFEYYWGQVRQG